MRSAHSVSLQIYVFPFTCFAFSSFFCHFVSPSPSPLPSFPLIAQPHRAVCPGGCKGEIGAPFRSPASPLPSVGVGPLAGFACILLTRMSTSGRRVGEGRFFFISPPLSSFPLILFCLAACATIACNCTGGVLALCVQCFVDASALRRSLERCRRGQREGVGATAENTGATARKRGAFCTASPVRLRQWNPPRVVESCRRRARESADSARRERDECRAKT